MATATLEVGPLGLENPMGTDGFEFVEYTAPDIELLRSLFTKMGFPEVACHKTKDVTLHKQGDCNFVINAEPGSYADDYAKAHGPSACAMDAAVPVEASEKDGMELAGWSEILVAEEHLVELLRIFPGHVAERDPSHLRCGVEVQRDHVESDQANGFAIEVRLSGRHHSDNPSSRARQDRIFPSKGLRVREPTVRLHKLEPRFRREPRRDAVDIAAQDG